MGASKRDDKDEQKPWLFCYSCEFRKRKSITEMTFHGAEYSLGDYDLGYEMTRQDYRLISSEDYVGLCNSNPITGTWCDTSLTRGERLKKRRSPKRSPFNEWWHFVHKKYGLLSAFFMA